MRLIDADELLKKYSFYKGKRIPEKDIDNFPVTVDISSIKKDIRNAPTIELSEWISVDDRLPTLEDVTDHDMNVIAIHKASKRRTWHFRSVEDNPFDFTYWQPLPKPPKEDTQ